MKRRYEFKARLWQSISVVALCSAFTLITVGCGQVFHQPKHTGPATVAQIEYEAVIFERPNREIFVMQFHNNHPRLEEGMRFDDVFYEDKGRDEQYFIKAIMAQGSTLTPDAKKILAKHTQQNASITLCPEGCTIQGVHDIAFH